MTHADLTDRDHDRAEDPAGSAPDHREVVAALQAVLRSTAFRQAPKARDLLAFVVTETIAERGHLLNERVLSRMALGRPPALDTRTDASARVQARRTRELLDRYYAGDGRDDTLRITIPTGQYAATIVRGPRRDRRDRAHGSGVRTTGPKVAVVEFRHRSAGTDRRVAAGVVESLVCALSRFPGLDVVGPVHAGAATPELDVPSVVDRTSADFVLHGGVSATAEEVRVMAHLAHGATREIRWSDAFIHDIDDFSGFDAGDEIVARVAAAVGDFGGVVFKEPLAVHPGADPRVAAALRGYYAFLDELAPAATPGVIAGLREAAAIEPDNAHLLSSLAFTHAVDVLLRGAVAEESVAFAAEHGRQALRLDPTDAVANNALAIVALVQGRMSTANRHAESALELAPYHPGNTYVAGMVVAAAGDWDRGIAIVRRVVRVNPYGPSHRRTLLALAALIDGDPSAAFAEASLVHVPGSVHGPLIRAACLAALDLLDEAAAELAAVGSLCPGVLADPEAFIGATPTIPPHAARHVAERIRSVIDRTGFGLES